MLHGIWHKLSDNRDTPNPRQGHASAIIQSAHSKDHKRFIDGTSADLFVLWGGSIANGLTSQICKMDIGTWQECKSAGAEPRAAYAMTSNMSNLYLFGGVKEKSSSENVNGDFTKITTNELLEYDTKMSRFSQLSSVSKDTPAPRIAATLTYVPVDKVSNTDALLYLYGGISGNGEYFGSLQVFNMRTREWTYIEGKGEKPPAISAHTCVYYQSPRRRLLVFYGGRGIDGLSNELFYLNLDNMRWVYPWENRAQDIRPDQVTQHTAVVHGKHMIVQGGLGSWNSDPFSVNLETFEWNRIIMTPSQFRPDTYANHSSSIVHSTLLLLNQQLHHMIYHFGGARANDKSNTADNTSYYLELSPLPTLLVYTSATNTLAWAAEDAYKASYGFKYTLQVKSGQAEYTTLLAETSDKKFIVKTGIEHGTADKPFMFEEECVYSFRLSVKNFAGPNEAIAETTVTVEKGLFNNRMINFEAALPDEEVELESGSAFDSVVAYSSPKHMKLILSPAVIISTPKSPPHTDTLTEEDALTQVKTPPKQAKVKKAPVKRKSLIAPMNVSNEPSPLTLFPFSSNAFPFNLLFGTAIKLSHLVTAGTKTVPGFHEARAISYTILKEKPLKRNVSQESTSNETEIQSEEGSVPGKRVDEIRLRVHWNGWPKVHVFDVNLDREAGESDAEWFGRLTELIQVSDEVIQVQKKRKRELTDDEGESEDGEEERVDGLFGTKSDSILPAVLRPQAKLGHPCIAVKASFPKK